MLGAPSTTHSTYFQSIHLFHELNEGNLLPEKFQFIVITKIRPMILGDGAFQMKPWMCKPFGEAGLREKKCDFSCCLIHAYMVSEGAFDKLKSPVRLLHRKCKSSKESVKAMCLAAVVCITFI